MGRTPTGRPTSFDIAYRAGVSQPTVSRALRGDKSVSQATREKIERIARELNYAVDARREHDQPVLPLDARFDHPRLR